MSHGLHGAFRGVDIPNHDVLTNCMHCGLCLPQCPTYALTGLERSSPRGRIRLIKAVAEGDLPMSEGFIHEMNFCLDCQACETACPAGVKYGSLVEAARVQIAEQNYETFLTKFLKKWFLVWFFQSRSRFHFLSRLLWLYEASGLKWFLARSGLLRLFARKLSDLQPLTPSISRRFSSRLLPHVLPARGEARFRVGFLTGCIMDVAYAEVNLDTIELLRSHGCDVVIPEGQGCCGSLHAHYGEMSAARDLARRNIEIFARENLDAIVMNSAGCGAFMKEYGHIFGEMPDIASLASSISARVKDITEFLVETGLLIHPSLRNGGAPFAGRRVTYHDACHLVHTQKISQQPRTLIRSIPGITYVELDESTWCCGSAGIYNITQYESSMQLLQRKVQHIRNARPDILVTANPGCMVQIQHGLAQAGLRLELMHTATFLRRACVP